MYVLFFYLKFIEKKKELRYCVFHILEGDNMSKAFTVKNHAGKFKHFLANDEEQAAKMAISLKMGKKTGRMKVSNYDFSRHKIMEQNYIKLLECRNAIGELKKESNVFESKEDKNNIVDFDGCFRVICV